MRLLPALVAAVLLLGGCQPKQRYIDKGYVRLSAVKGQPAAFYFTVHGGPTDETLLSVHSDTAIRSELHESVGAGGMSSMKPLGSVAVPAGSAVAFAPGGRHVMLTDVNPIITPGRLMIFQFTFADGTRLQYDAPVIAAGDPAPK